MLKDTIWVLGFWRFWCKIKVPHIWTEGAPMAYKFFYRVYNSYRRPCLMSQPNSPSIAQVSLGSKTYSKQSPCHCTTVWFINWWWKRLPKNRSSIPCKLKLDFSTFGKTQSSWKGVTASINWLLYGVSSINMVIVRKEFFCQVVQLWQELALASATFGVPLHEFCFPKCIARRATSGLFACPGRRTWPPFTVHYNTAQMTWWYLPAVQYSTITTTDHRPQTRLAGCVTCATLFGQSRRPVPGRTCLNQPYLLLQMKHEVFHLFIRF